MTAPVCREWAPLQDVVLGPPALRLWATVPLSKSALSLLTKWPGELLLRKRVLTPVVEEIAQGGSAKTCNLCVQAERFYV